MGTSCMLCVRRCAVTRMAWRVSVPAASAVSVAGAAAGVPAPAAVAAPGPLPGCLPEETRAPSPVPGDGCVDAAARP